MSLVFEQVVVMFPVDARGGLGPTMFISSATRVRGS